MPSAISIWSGVSENQIDQRTHFWYESDQGLKRRVCDDLASPGAIQEPDPEKPLIPCQACQNLYVQDMAFGRRVLDYLPLPSPNSATHIPDLMVYSPKIGEAYHKNRMADMLERPSLGMATFARFYDAPASQRARIVREARTFWIDPDGYRKRNYYWAVRNTLSRTHWSTNDLSDFENAQEEMLSKLPYKKGKHSRNENYQVVSRAYLKFWSKQQDAQFFKIPRGSVQIAGLTILVNPEVGMRRRGDELALKLWFSVPRPKRAFRQAIQYLMSEAQHQGWQRHLQPALWDLRREEILPNVPLPKDFDWVIRGQASAFREMWDGFGPQEEIEVN